MRDIRRILVGIELHSKRGEVTSGSRNALTQATWLAKELGAELLLLHSTWTDAYPDPDGLEVRMTDEEHGALDALVSSLRDEGARARLEVVAERPWLAICHAVLRGEADLVMVGKRNESVTEGRRLGTVAVKLLRYCPGPVWVVKPEHDLVHKLVLSATDLSAVGDQAVNYGAFVAEHHGAELHVVHAFQVPMSLQLSCGRIPDEEYAAGIEKIKSQAQAHIDRQLTESTFDGESVVHIGRNAPYLAIREAVQHLHPDLLVMGTVSRGGVAGVLVGNTAERILDRVDCSILTVKPEDFVSPIEVPAR